MSKKETMPVPIAADLLIQIDSIAVQSSISRTKIVNLIIRQFIEEPQFRRPLIVLGSGPRTTYGIPLDNPVEEGQKEPPPISVKEQEHLISDQQHSIGELDVMLKSDGMDVSSYKDLFPQSTIVIDESIIVRHFGPPAEYELNESLTRKGLFTTQYKEAIQKLYDDPDLNLKNITSVKERRNHITEHIIALIQRGLIENSRPTSDEVESKREKQDWEQYIDSNGEFIDTYVDAIITYYRDKGTDFNVDELNQVVNKSKHIETFLPKMREAHIAI